MKKIKNYKKRGITKFLIMALVLGGGLIYGVQMVQKNQENRSSAATCTPKTGLNSFSVDTACSGGNFRYMTFACYDGFGRREGSATSCKSSTTWKAYAESYCIGHTGGCPTPTVSPINGICGNVKNICTKGTFSDVTDISSKYLWKCVGSNGGTTISCSLSK